MAYLGKLKAKTGGGLGGIPEGGAAVVPAGDAIFTAFGATTPFTVPKGVTSLCMVVIGSGAGSISLGGGIGGGGGALAYINNYPVTPGDILYVTTGVFGGNGNGTPSYITHKGTTIIYAGGGLSKYANTGAGGSWSGIAGAKGNNGGAMGGAAGYTGNGASYTYAGEAGLTLLTAATGDGAGGGGGTGLYGSFQHPENYRIYGAGTQAQGTVYGQGGVWSGQYTTVSGAARILWGPGRAFPDTLVRYGQGQ